MTKGPSEAMFRAALNEVDIEPLFAHKLADDARNWKPADYLVWFRTGDGPASSAWFEVKETPNKGALPMADIRPSQLRGIDTARALHLPYFLAIRWKPDGLWSIVDAVRLMDWWTDDRVAAAPAALNTSVSRDLLESRFGVSSTKGQLPSIVKAALNEGL